MIRCRNIKILVILKYSYKVCLEKYLPLSIT